METSSSCAAARGRKSRARHPTRGARCAIFALSALPLLLGARAAHADPTPPEAQPEPPDPYATYRYANGAADRTFFRAILEGLGVLSVGYVEYLVSTHQSDRGSHLVYDGSIFHDKLSGNAQSFDANQFGTNFIGHPLGGTLYYTAARSNRLSVAQSFAWAFTGSLIWEYLGEIGEKPSYNDMIATPWGGFANGETFTQLSSFFARGRLTVHNRALQFLFGTPRSVHDWADGLDPEPAESYDALGFPTDIFHDFRFAIGAGATFQTGANGKGTTQYHDHSVALDLEVRNLPRYGRAGKESRFFDDGNIAALRVNVQESEGRLVHGKYEARITPAGYYVHDAVIDRRGHLRGASDILGVSFGYEYGVHDYDRDRRRPIDLLSKVTLVGLLAEHTSYFSGWTVRTGLAVDADFAGVRSYALPAYLERHTDLDLPFVLRNEGYYYAVGPSVTPRITVARAPFEAMASLSLEDFQGVVGVDVDQSAQTLNITRSDRRLGASGRLAWRPYGPFEVAASVDARRREGRMGEAREARSEKSVMGAIGVRF